MKIDFNGLRLQTVEHYNAIIDVLNKAQKKVGRGVEFKTITPLDLVEHLDGLRDCLSTLVNLYDNKGEFDCLENVELKMLSEPETVG